MIELKNQQHKILEYAQKFYSSQTQLIHLSYEKRPFARSDSAPIYHNFLYALILLRTKQRSKMEDAMQLIERLLHFQILEGDNSGNFPRYIHEYPYCERRFEVVDSLLAMYWIYKDFSIILPKELKSKLVGAIQQAVSYLINLIQETDYSYLLRIQIYSLLKAFGDIFQDQEWQNIGQQGLNKALSSGSDKGWGSVRHLSKMVLYLSLFSQKSNSMYLESFWNFLKQSWHKNLSAYTGPGLNEHYYQSSQEATIYHYFMDKKAQLFDADFMEAILIPHIDIESSFEQQTSLSYTLTPFEIHQHQENSYSYSFFNLDKSQWEKRGGFYPFKLMFNRASNACDTFVLQMGSFATVNQISKGKLLLTFENDPLQELDISFFGNLSSGVEIVSNNNKAAMFDLSSPLEFKYENLKVLMTFPNLEPNRGIHGQLLRDNRRSQMVKSFNHTYDWHLYFRKTKSGDKAPFQIQLELIV
ncbi:MAG: hypothetical protein S4CHLAM6_06330 [Chlamydiae bacterium]|nr:hypothetical protein [Chlamydiota bacterium]